MPVLYAFRASKAISDIKLQAFIHYCFLSLICTISVHYINVPMGLLKHERGNSAHTYLA